MNNGFVQNDLLCHSVFDTARLVASILRLRQCQASSCLVRLACLFGTTTSPFTLSTRLSASLPDIFSDFSRLLLTCHTTSTSDFQQPYLLHEYFAVATTSVAALVLVLALACILRDQLLQKSSLAMGMRERMQGLLPSMPQDARRQPRFQQQPSPRPQMQYQHQQQSPTQFFDYSGEFTASSPPHETLLTRPSAPPRAQQQPSPLLTIVPSHEAFAEARRVVQAERAAYEQRALQNLHSASFQPAQSTSKSLFTPGMSKSLTVSSDVGLQPYPYSPSPSNAPAALPTETLAGDVGNSFQDEVEPLRVDPLLENDFDRQLAQGDFSDSRVSVVDGSFDEASPSLEQVEIPVPAQQEMIPQPGDPAAVTPPQQSLDVDRIVQEGWAQLAKDWDGMEVGGVTFNGSGIEDADETVEWPQQLGQPTRPQQTASEYPDLPQQDLDAFSPRNDDPVDLNNLEAAQDAAADLHAPQYALHERFGEGNPDALAPVPVVNVTATPTPAVNTQVPITASAPAPNRPQRQQRARARPSAPYDQRTAWQGRVVRDQNGWLCAQRRQPGRSTRHMFHSLVLTHPAIPAQWQQAGLASAHITHILNYYVSIVQLYSRETLDDIVALGFNQPYHELDHRVFFAEAEGIPPRGWLPHDFRYQYQLGGQGAQAHYVSNKTDLAIIGFPMLHEPLPVGTTCGEIVSNYPNHLKDDFLDGFCQNDIKPSELFRGVPYPVLKAFRDTGIILPGLADTSSEDNFLTKRMQKGRKSIKDQMGPCMLDRDLKDIKGTPEAAAYHAARAARYAPFVQLPIRIQAVGTFLTLRPQAGKGADRVTDYAHQQVPVPPHHLNHATAPVQHAAPIQQAPAPAQYDPTQMQYAQPVMQHVQAPPPAQYAAPVQQAQPQAPIQRTAHQSTVQQTKSRARLQPGQQPDASVNSSPVSRAPVFFHVAQSQGGHRESAANTPIDLTWDSDSPSDHSVLTPGVETAIGTFHGVAQPGHAGVPRPVQSAAPPNDAWVGFDFGAIHDANFDTEDEVQPQRRRPAAPRHQPPQAATHHIQPQTGKRRRSPDVDQDSIVSDPADMGRASRQEGKESRRSNGRSIISYHHEPAGGSDFTQATTRCGRL